MTKCKPEYFSIIVSGKSEQVAFKNSEGAYLLLNSLLLLLPGHVHVQSSNGESLQVKDLHAIFSAQTLKQNTVKEPTDILREDTLTNDDWYNNAHYLDK